MIWILFLGTIERSSMDTLAIIISLVSLAFAVTAYWRAGGKQDIEHARLEIEREIESLRTKQKELVESIAENITATYEASRKRLQHAREVLRQATEEAVEGLEQQIERARAQLEALTQQLEEAARSARDTTITSARDVEQAIAVRVRRVEARMMLLHAKAKTLRAVGAAGVHELPRAEELLEEAAELLRTARATLADDHAYDELFDNVKGALRDATMAVRTRAEDIRRKIEQVLSATDHLVGSLESDEQKAANPKEPGAQAVRPDVAAAA